MRLLDPTPLEPGHRTTQSELRELAVAIAESGVTAKEFANEHGIPYERALRAFNSFEGLVKKIRGPQPPSKAALARRLEQTRRRQRRSYLKQKRLKADRQWRQTKENANGTRSDQ